MAANLRDALDTFLQRSGDDLVALRRDIHAHPELGRTERRATALVAAKLAAAGLTPRLLPGTGLVCDVGAGGPVIALRADLDALPIAETTGAGYASTTAGVSHACGHDVHTTVLVGTALALARAELPGTVRCVFQPAEELTPGGALDVLDSGELHAVQRIFALHCDPRLPVGSVGIRSGPITAAADSVELTVTGPGGHTSRPQLTAEVIYALGALATQLPGLLSRRVDPRSGMSLVWGAVHAGVAFNAIPESGVLRGTVRVLDSDGWAAAGALITELATGIVAPTRAAVAVGYHRGVPPVVNEIESAALFSGAISAALGPECLSDTGQSMGGEDFGWYTERMPGALARLGSSDGVRGGDLHQGAFDVDERAIGVGVRVLTQLAVDALAQPTERHGVARTSAT